MRFIWKLVCGVPPDAGGSSEQGCSEIESRKSKVVCNGLADVCKGFPAAKVRSRNDGVAVQEDGNVFAGVIGARPGRIVAVVGGDDEEVAGLEPLEETRGGRASNSSSALP